MPERERAWTLFGVLAFITLFIYRESERRRDYVDGELTTLSRGVLEARAKAEGAAEAAKARDEDDVRTWRPWERRLAVIASIVGIMGVVTIVIAYHLFGF